MSLRALANLIGDKMFSLPVAILYITDKCNSRCISCDYWRFGQKNMDMALVKRLTVELPQNGTSYVLLSGGEPLMHPEWDVIASMFKDAGLKVGMVTSGIMLPKLADKVAATIDELYISLDGATPQSYKAIRGVDGLGLIEHGTRALIGKLPITFRTTVQRMNYREIPAMIRLTRSWQATHHSFLAVDVTTHAAFARQGDFDQSLTLAQDDLEVFDRVLDEVDVEFVSEFESGYIAESPQKLRRLRQYFGGVNDIESYPDVRCNAPRFSTVIETDGSLRPCYFLPSWGKLDDIPLREALNMPEALHLRRAQRLGQREECGHCVCSAYKGARALVFDQ